MLLKMMLLSSALVLASGNASLCEASDKSSADNYYSFSSFPKWVRVKDSISHKHTENYPANPIDVLAKINRQVNKTIYVSDQANFGIGDFWQKPSEFYIKGGDCEDYAIAKYAALLQHGFKDEDIWLVIVQKKSTQELHAVLQVTIEGKMFVLDSDYNTLMLPAHMDNFIQFYKINRVRWMR